MTKNQARAENAADVLDYVGGDDPETTLIDLLTNLLHFCDQTSVDFDNCLRISRGHFEAETGGAE